MIRHAARAVPWAVIVLGTGLVPLLLLIVERWPYAMWPLQGTAVGVLAATAAWCFDEPAAAVVDTLPRHLGWRTVARCTGVLFIVIGWALTLAATSGAYFGHTADVAWQGAAAVLLTVAVVTWRRSRGAATPARAVAAAVVPVAMFLALVRPIEGHLPLFPYTSTGDWATSRLLWTSAVLCAMCFAIGQSGRAWWRDRRGVSTLRAERRLAHGVQGRHVCVGRTGDGRGRTGRDLATRPDTGDRGARSPARPGRG